MIKSDEYIEYLAQSFVTYLSTPLEERKKAKENRKVREPWTTRWFGMLPMSVGLLVKSKQEDEAETPN